MFAAGPLLGALLLLPGLASAQIALVAAGTASNGNVSTVSPAAPAGIQANDVLVIVAHTYSNIAHAVTTGTGWAEVGAQGGDATGGRLSVWWKRATGASESTPTLTATANAESFASQMFAFRGCTTSGNPWDQVSANTTQAANNTFTGANLTSTVANVMVVFVGGSMDNNSWVTPGGSVNTLGGSNLNNAGLDDSTFLAYDSTPSNSPGALGAPTLVQQTVGPDAGRWLTFSLKPSATVTIDDAPAVGNTTITQTQPTALDGFTLTPSTGTANVTAVTVGFTAGNGAVSSVSINSAATCGGTSYGSVSTPGASASIPTNFSLSAATTYYVCVTGGPVASNTAVTGNVSSVTATGYTSSDNDSANATVTVRPAVISIGDGPVVGNSSIQATQTAALDAFTLTPEAGTAGVTAVTVGFTAGNGAVSSVSIDSASSCGGTSYGSLSSPGASAAIPTTISLAAATTYYVCVTAAAVGGSTAVTGNVSSVTAANYSSTDGDTTNATVTVQSTFVGEGDPTANSTKPAVSIVNPVSGPVGATFKVQARVYSPVGDISSVVLQYNASSQPMTPSSFYGSTATSGVWEYAFSGLAAGTYTLRAQAFNASGDVFSRKVIVTISATGRGDGNLLVRDNASQLCGDCHAIKTHSSETTSSQYGSWSMTCRDCHTPHSTHNLGLVREQITPPSLTQEEAPRAVVFRNRSGYTTGGMANPENNGVCQVCHTRTKNYRQDGTLVTHETGKDCSSCHKHVRGLQVVCTDCHGDAGRASIAGADAKQTAAPPADASGAGATVYVANGGAHVAHVNQITYRSAPLACSNCHTIPNTHQTPSQTDVVWTGLASSGGVTPTPAAGALTGAWTSTPTCTNYCHGASLTGGSTPSWTGNFTATCAQCHGSPPPVTTATNANHPQNTACDACHGLFGNAGYDFAGKSLSAAAKGTHLDGTLQRPTKGCASCHGDITVTDGTVVDRLDGRAAPGYNANAVDTRGNDNLDRATAVGVGAHAKHILGGGIMAAKGCTVCHALPANGNEDHADAAPTWAWSAPANSESVTPAYTQPSCTNYCHSNAKPLGQGSATTVSIAWTSTTALGCSSCHKTVAGGATDLSAKHGRHLTYGYTCDECHAPTMQNDSSSTIGTVANHVDGTKEVDFSTTFKVTTIDQSGGAYSGSPGYTCASTYCHSNGTLNAAPFGAPTGTALAWDVGTTAAACDNCHAGNAAATFKLATGSHGAHVNNAAYLGANVACAQCHDATIGADDRTLDGLTGLVSHVNGQKDVGAASWSDVAKTCSANSCHSNGTEALVAADYKPVTWGNTLANDCLGCHGSFSPAAFTAVYGEPNYANDTGNVKTRNSHAKHVSPVLATAKTQCVSCHAGTVDATGALLTSGGLHVNDARNVSGAAIASYDEATETCSSISCHGGGNATWGATLGCGGCHGTASRVKTIAGTVDANLVGSPPVDAAGLSTGLRVGAHMKHVDSDTYRANGLLCADCHPSAIQHNGTRDAAWSALASADGATMSPAAGNGAYSAAWETTPTCTNYCHGNTLNGGTNKTPSWGATGMTCSSCHGAAPPVSATAGETHPQNTTCANCHGAGYATAGLSGTAKTYHVNGSIVAGTDKPNNGCTACHGVLAGVSGAAVLNTSMTAAPGYVGGTTGVDTAGASAVSVPSVGAHDAHVRPAGSLNAVAALDCSNCHNTKPVDGNTSHANATILLGWSTLATGSGTITPTPSAFTAAWESTPTCTNYCHSNASPSGTGATLSTPAFTWTSASNLTCSSCHAVVGRDRVGGLTSDLSQKHGKHVSAYTYTCDECHASTVQNDSSSVIGTPANHVNGAKNWQFSTTATPASINQSGGSYAAGTCASTYCHSNGTATSTPFGAPTGTALSWNTGVTDVDCDNCHAGNASATFKLATGSHAAHMNNAAYLGANVACAQCHDATIGADDRTLDGLTGLVNHVDGQKDVSAASWSDVAKTCSANSCHSNGTEALVAADYKPVTWGNTLANDCLGCHGSFSPAAFTAVYGEPNYANNTGNVKTRNSHSKHVSPVLATAKTQCVSCHAGTVDATGALLTPGGLHVNDARNVSGAGIGSYDEATETCSSIACHAGKNATWGATLACSDCHGTAGRTKDASVSGTVDANLVGSPPIDAAGASTGVRVGAHLKHVNSGTYRTNALVCADCHPSAVQHNGTRDAAWSSLATGGGTATMSPAAGNGAYSAAWETTPTCTNHCHGNTLNGGTNKTPSWTSTGMTCSSCHGAPPPVSATASETHPQNTTCANCHGAGYATAGLSGTAKNFHVNGTMVGGTDKPNNGCTACHGVLAGVSGAAVLNTSMTAAPGYNGTGVDTTGGSSVAVVSVGAHDAHVRDEGAANLVAPLDCSNCHGTKPADGTTAHANNTILLGWSTIATGNGIVASPTPAAFNAAFETTPSCTNYCHSNARPLGQASATTTTVSWTSATGMTCTSCHSGAATGGGTNLSVAHLKHTDAFGNAGYALTCDRCHVSSATSNSAIVSGGGQHVDGTRDVSFDTSGPNNSGGTYTYAAAPAYTCSNTYCHSPGSDRTAGYVSGPSAAWNAAAPLACTSCHGFGTTMVNQAHGAHTNQAATYATTYGCQTCHYPTTQNGTTVASTSLHVNFAANVDGNPAGNLKYQDAGNTVANSCTTYCHSAGSKLTGGTPPQFYSNMAWPTATLTGCANCHGAYSPAGHAVKASEPNYASGGVSSLQANSHFAHVGDATSCVNCHNQTVDATGTTILNTGKHINGMGDIAFSAAYATTTYTPRSGNTAPGCVNVSCHDNPAQSSQWGGTITEGPCYTCHLQAGAGNGDVDDYLFQNGTRAYVDEEDWNAYGHGRATAFSLTGQSGNAAPDFAVATEQGCFYCHTPKLKLFAAGEEVAHGLATNPFRLTNSTWGGTKNGTCLICHASTPAGFDPDGGSAAFAPKIASAGARVSATHYGADHLAAGKGGELCWDCHDPHGDFNYTPSNRLIAFMIQERPTRTHTLSDPNGWGIPQLTPVSELTANTVDFSAAVSGTTTVFDGTDYAETGASAPYNGVCQVCHTATAYHLDSGAGRTHMTGAQCTKCHSHSQAVATDAFKQATGCGDCHAASPTASGKHTLHVGAATPAYGSVTPAATAGAYAYNCGKCHTTVATNHYNFNTGGTTTTPYQVEVAFDWTSGPTPYALGTASNDTSPVGLVFRTTTGTCATWCHSNAAPAGGTNAWASPTWDTAAAATICTSCHKMLATTTVPDTNLSHGHYLHTTNAAGGYFYNCSDCHNGIATGKADYPTTAGTIADKAKHVDGSPSVAFNTTFNPGTPSYNVAPTRTCANTYCHSNGTNAASPPANTSIAWTATRAADCTSCHGGNATAGTVIGTNEHSEHVNKLAYLGTNIACGKCHSGTVAAANDRAITTLTAHVNRTAEVTMTEGGTYGGVSTKTCSSTYCHSDGTETPGYKTGLDWDLGQTLADDCKACHGGDTAFTSAYGEPNYTERVTTSDDVRNSHSKHVSTTLAIAKTQCVDCHSAAIDATGALKAAGTHLNALVEITVGGKIGTYTAAGETCTGITCHGGGNAQWGATLTCLGCHTGTEGGALGDGSGNAVDDEWAVAAGGHGGAAGGTLTSALNGCDYCHDLGSAHTPAAATNPYRLRYSATANTLCLQCHLTGDAGININSAGTALALENSTKNVDAAHDGTEHSAGEGGMFCWDCHDPHGVPTNIKMVKRAISKTADPYGVPLTTGVVNFTNNACTAPGAGCSVEATNNPRQGVCQACHSPTGTSSYWRWDGTGNTHNADKVCSGCHAHKDKFKGKGGGSDCYGCHAAGQGTRRAISGDFTKQSHHVRGIMSSAVPSTAGTGNNADCVVCHSEGQIITAYSTDCSTGTLPMTCTNTAWHANGKIDLRDVDVAAPGADTAGTATFVYDKAAVAASAGAATPGNWSSADQAWREWTSGVDEAGGQVLPAKAGLDKFCLNCHDSGGAAQIASFKISTEASRTATDPFWDGTIDNTYDQLPRPSVIDVKSKVNGAPPAQGAFARHAIRGQSTSKYANYTTAAAWPSNPNAYSTIFSANRFVQRGTDEAGKPNWNDTSVMGCADCHTSDGANTTSGNAHGSGSEYLLKDVNGLATEGTKAAANYVCYRCHAVGTVSTNAHTGGNGGDFVDTTASTGATRKGSNGSMFGMTCTNCHGGGQGDTTGVGDSNGFGWIHGTSQFFPTYSGAVVTPKRNAYRFMNGGSLRFWSPSSTTWDSGAGSCYTLGTADTYGGCTKHGSATGSTHLKRPLTY